MESTAIPMAETSASSFPRGGGDADLTQGASGFGDGQTGLLEPVPSKGEAPDRRIRDGGDNGKRYSEC
jgi:hypothetical protein